MDEVVTASPGEDSPLLNTEADTVYLPVTVSGGNAEVITGSDTGEGAAVDSPRYRLPRPGCFIVLPPSSRYSAFSIG